MTDDRDKDICGRPTDKGAPCQNPAGSCPHHSDGRPSKLTRERQEAIAAMLEEGHSIIAACECNGIGRSTYYDWLERGEQERNTIFSDFSDRVKRARREGEKHLIDLAKNAAIEKKDARTLLEMARRQFPESWDEPKDESDEAEEKEFNLVIGEPQSESQVESQ